MNFLFFTHSRTLNVLYELYLRFKKQTEIDRVGFYVADLIQYERFLAAHPDFEKQFVVLKEWDIYRQADGHIPDLHRIKAYEDEIGDPNLLGPIVNDRRLSLGSDIDFHQDYRPRFTYEEQLSIIDVALQRIDELFRMTDPDVVCTIYPATFGDSLGHLFSQSRGIMSFDLRLARLRNHVMLVDGINEPPPHMVDLFEQFQRSVPAELVEKAEEYIKSIRERTAMYEGVIPAGQLESGLVGSTVQTGLVLAKAITRGLARLKRYRKFKKAPYRYDLQNPHGTGPLIPVALLRKLNLRRARSVLRDRIVGETEFSGLNYVLYPLHSEPEVVLTQFAWPYLNQIEVVRNTSLSMPIGMQLLVKEHPAMVGRRPPGYYQKLAEIPNVRIVDFNLPSEVALEHARLVVIIRGAIGLEAVTKRIPVVSLGQSMFQLLPPCMFRTCWNLYELPDAIRYMLDNYRYDHESLVRYLATVIKGSVPVNLITDLLGKRGRFRSGDVSGDVLLEEHPHLDILADYCLERIRQPRNTPSASHAQ